MRRDTFNRLRAFVAALAFTVAAVAAAQSGSADVDAYTYTYDISQFGQALGQTTMSMERSAEGYTARSSVAVAGVFQADNVLETRPDGSATAYSISGTAQGAAFQIDVAFTDAGADLTFTQGGTTSTLSVPGEQPFYVFDNNFLEGFQLAADQVLAAGQERTFAGLVPQVASVAVLQFQAPKPGTVEYLGAEVQATQLDVAFAVPGQVLAMQLYLDEAGRILVLEQQPGNVRFVRRAAEEQPSQAAVDEAEAPAPEVPAPEASEGSSAAVRHATAQDLLQANAHCVMEQEVSVASTGETLVGRLTLPVAATLEDGRPAPTVLILPGSGAVDMDGNALPFISNQMYKQLAFELACHGYGALRVAKLGIAPSTGDGNAVTLSTYAQNTADWLALLATLPGVDGSRLAVLGHSEGGLVALYSVAAGYAQPAAVVTLAAPGRPLDVLLREQLIASFVRSGIAGEDLARLTRQTDEAIAALSSVEGATLALEGDLAGNPIAESFAHAAGLLRSEFEQDPAQLATHVRVPALVLQGLKDVQVQRADGRRLADALPRATLLEFADLGHNLNRVPGAPETGMVPHPDTTVSATLVRSLVTWLNGYLRTAR